MCWIDCQFKKLISLKDIILETPYTFSLYSVGILVLCTLSALSPVFSNISNSNLFLFCLKDMEKM